MKQYLLPFLVAFSACVLLLIVLLPLLRKLKAGQEILQYVTEHTSKQGTPTMGGIAFILSTSIVALCFCGLSNKSIVVTIVVFVAYGVVGFLDDYLKIKFRHNMGLRAYQKIVVQLVIAILVALFVYGDPTIGDKLYVPFLGTQVSVGRWIVPIVVFIYLACTNGVNLTDGLDGLASSVSLIVGGCFAFYASHLYAAEITVLSAALMGGALGFLLFNYHPAKIFMGDTGSLFLGGLAVGISFLCRSPLLIVFCGIIFYLEGLSVVLQVVYFRFSGGKRLFKMAPLHHHFEKSGWSEEKIVCVFTLLSLLGAVIGAFAYA